MQVEGGGSYQGNLLWYADQSAGVLPQPGVLWMPRWSFHVVMLLWSLWLVSRLIGLAKWGWTQLTVYGLWRWPPESSVLGRAKDRVAALVGDEPSTEAPPSEAPEPSAVPDPDPGPEREP